MTDPLERMRRANPVPSADMPDIEPVLARLAAGDDPPAPRRRPRRRGLFGVIFVPLAAAAVAVAASGLLTGEPLRGATTFTPTKGLGVPVASSVRLLDLSVPDPAGGPAWGMRTLSTTRGLGCIQIGRLDAGRLGVLGRNGAFGDDGKFHELPPEVLDHANCTLLDGAGRTYVAVSHRGMPASALATGCRIRRIPAAILDRLPGRGREHGPQPPLCARGDVRILLYGTLGPEAESVTHRAADGSRVTTPVVSPQGAYLIVLPPGGGRPLDGQWTTLPGPGSGLESVRYRDGHVCRIRSPQSIGGAKPCPPVGYVKPRHPRVTSADVAAPIRVTLRRHTSAAGPRVPARHPLHRPRGGPRRAVRLRVCAAAREQPLVHGLRDGRAVARERRRRRHDPSLGLRPGQLPGAAARHGRLRAP
jgi:hypothetical protein